MNQVHDWLQIHRGEAPLIISFPHTGTDLPAELEGQFVSPWLARRDADWHVHQLYDFVRALGATTVRTSISRSVIDVNRDPSGVSLYPGQNTTGLCPVTTFDDQPLYRDGLTPDEKEIERRTYTWFHPYHQALDAEIARLRARHAHIVVYDAHSIRSHIPHLFDGELPQFNIGTNSGTSCNPALQTAVEARCAASGFSNVLNGRFKGGWITRKHADPHGGVHSIQMELACRGYMDEPAVTAPDTWPTPYTDARAAALQAVLRQVMDDCLHFTSAHPFATSPHIPVRTV
ncbi:N-formylglutamate deformylase [Pseudoxanthomonas sp.]|uniref:N-formylglutamate deformylase n=1 Tax=Pseudoxanthomonas sp. TaxID=1871049 RepID=UPI00262C9C98|nr:N-formylglutamate deformylase [Pseudoxanthomonas sp.]WDS36601.1 MAG: N-formylglutamate deformylase [Pseudoxanthomonas sp.]